MSDNVTERTAGDSAKRPGFFKRLWRAMRSMLILAMILAPCGYAVKLHLKLLDAQETADSLRTALSESSALLDSLKVMQDKEILLRDSLDDLVEKKLDEGASEAMIVIDTTMDWLTARKAIEEKIDLSGWLDTLCAAYPEGVAAHVKLRYLESRAIRLERLNHHYLNKFPEKETGD